MSTNMTTLMSANMTSTLDTASICQQSEFMFDSEFPRLWKDSVSTPWYVWSGKAIYSLCKKEENVMVASSALLLGYDSLE
jgi:hypothetical protein